MCIRAANEGDNFGAFLNVYKFLSSAQSSTSQTYAACLSRRIDWLIVQPNADSSYWLASPRKSCEGIIGEKSYTSKHSYLWH